jgi:hypothetical protein
MPAAHAAAGRDLIPPGRASAPCQRGWPHVAARTGQQRGDAALVAALAAGATERAAAAQAGMSERSARRRMADPAFRALVHQAQTDVLGQAVATLTGASVKAASTLLGLLDASAPPTVRLGAARAILEFTGRLREEHLIEARLSAVEQALDLRKEA